MAWQTPPTWTVGQVLTKADLDILSNDLDELHEGNLSTGGVEARYGTPPALTSGDWIIKAGSKVVTLNGSANGTISFPGSAFSGGVITVVANNGDPNVAEFAIDIGDVIASGFDFHCHGPASNPASLAVRINYFAVGW